MKHPEDRQQIFYLMEQESLDSDAANIILLTTDADQIKETILSEIAYGRLEYEGEEMTEMEKNFERDWEEEEATMDDINKRLRYGYYGFGINGQYGQIYGCNYRF